MRTARSPEGVALGLLQFDTPMSWRSELKLSSTLNLKTMKSQVKFWGQFLSNHFCFD